MIIDGEAGAHVFDLASNFLSFRAVLEGSDSGYAEPI